MPPERMDDTILSGDYFGCFNSVYEGRTKCSWGANNCHLALCILYDVLDLKLDEFNKYTRLPKIIIADF